VREIYLKLNGKSFGKFPKFFQKVSKCNNLDMAFIPVKI
jgi:hypothetical protein